MLGSKLPLSNTKTLPQFSLSPRTDPHCKMVISSKHLVDMLGRDSPGVGAYEVDFDKLSRSVLNRKGKGGGADNYSFGATQKFFELSSVTNMKRDK
jgi:hypothetical protein